MRVVFCRYVSHADSEPRDDVSSANSDRPPAAVDERMQEYVETVKTSLRKGGSEEHHSDAETVQAALEVLGWFQRRLLEIGIGQIVDKPQGLELTRQRDWAFHVLADHGSKGWARQQQLEVTARRPLAICTGGGAARYVKTDLGKEIERKTGTSRRGLPTHTRGCFCVFEEAGNSAGKRWPRLCPRCRQRNPYRTAERALKANVKKYLAGRTST
jgi:hypothetical protein